MRPLLLTAAAAAFALCAAPNVGADEVDPAEVHADKGAHAGQGEVAAEAPAQPAAPVDPATAGEAEALKASATSGGLTATVIGLSGDAIGSASLTPAANLGALLRVEIGAGGLTPGWHGAHLHQVADCSDIGEFKMSGGHVGMVEGGHGLLNPDGPEPGDLPNIWAHVDGSAGFEAFTDLAAFAAHAPALLDGDGVAFIIHASPDDHLRQPIGGAGARVACAAFEGPMWEDAE